MGPDLWKLVRDGKGSVATHAVFAAAVRHSPLLGDFLEIVVGDQYRLFSTALSNKLFADYLEGCLQRDPEMPQWNETSRQRDSREHPRRNIDNPTNGRAVAHAFARF
jgi:hypothetical protein